MAESLGVTAVRDDFAKWVKKVLSPVNKQGALARAYTVYQTLQVKRFQTENASEGMSWPALNPKYKAYKLKRYGGGAKKPTQKDPRTEWASWPGNGRKMLIGTGTLAGAVVGPSQGNPFDQSGISSHQVLFTQNTMTVTISTSGVNAEGKPFVYPQYVNEKRPFMVFSDEHLQQMKDTVAQFMIGGAS